MFSQPNPFGGQPSSNSGASPFGAAPSPAAAQSNPFGSRAPSLTSAQASPFGARPQSSGFGSSGQPSAAAPIQWGVKGPDAAPPGDWVGRSGGGAPKDPWQDKDKDPWQSGKASRQGGGDANAWQGNRDTWQKSKEPWAKWDSGNDESQGNSRGSREPEETRWGQETARTAWGDDRSSRSDSWKGSSKWGSSGGHDDRGSKHQWAADEGGRSGHDDRGAKRHWGGDEGGRGGPDDRGSKHQWGGEQRSGSNQKWGAEKASGQWWGREAGSAPETRGRGAAKWGASQDADARGDAEGHHVEQPVVEESAQKRGRLSAAGDDWNYVPTTDVAGAKGKDKGKGKGKAKGKGKDKNGFKGKTKGMDKGKDKSWNTWVSNESAAPPQAAAMSSPTAPPPKALPHPKAQRQGGLFQNLTWVPPKQTSDSAQTRTPSLPQEPPTPASTTGTASKPHAAPHEQPSVQQVEQGGEYDGEYDGEGEEYEGGEEEEDWAEDDYYDEEGEEEEAGEEDDDDDDDVVEVVETKPGWSNTASKSAPLAIEKKPLPASVADALDLSLEETIARGSQQASGTFHGSTAAMPSQSLPPRPQTAPPLPPKVVRTARPKTALALHTPAAQQANKVRNFLEHPDTSPLSEGDTPTGGDTIIGTLQHMCSSKEMDDRSTWRQLDVLEMAKGSTIEKPLVNKLLAVKKYQRSSADKAYHAEDIRTLTTCARALWYLFTHVLEADIVKTPNLCGLADNVTYWQVYSFLRDRTRGVRVDLHVQQPWSTDTMVYIIAHEACLRFEIMSMYLLTTREDILKKYDQKMAHKACSMVMEPLLNAYVQARERAASGKPAYVSPSEASIRCYTILLLLVGGEGNTVFKHLRTLPVELLRHPAIGWATAVASAYICKDYGRFIRLYLEADFLSAAILSCLMDLVRQRILWRMVRCTAPIIRDKMLLEDLCRRLAFTDPDVATEFLNFNGLEVIELGTGKKMVQLPAYNPKTKSWHVMYSEKLQTAFNEKLGTNLMPAKCDFQQRMDEHLHAKYKRLMCSRADIIFGAADVQSGAGCDVPVIEEDKEILEDFDAPPAIGSKSPESVVPEGAEIEDVAETAPILATQENQPVQPSRTPFLDITSSPKAPSIFKPEVVLDTGKTSIFQSSQSTGQAAFTSFHESGTLLSNPFAPAPTLAKAKSPERRSPEKRLQAASEPSQSPAPERKKKRGRQSSVSQALQEEKALDFDTATAATREVPVRLGPSATKLSPFQAPELPQSVGLHNQQNLFSDQLQSRDAQAPAAAAVPKSFICPTTSAAVADDDELRWATAAGRADTKSSALAPTLREASKPSAEFAAYLFRVSRAFSAWSRCCREERGWSRWASSAQPDAKRMRSSRASFPGSCRASPRVVLGRMPPAVKVAEAVKQAGVKLPACTLCVHRFALLLPPVADSAALEGETQQNILGHLVAGLFLPALRGTPNACNQETDRNALPGSPLLPAGGGWATRLLQQEEVSARPRLGASLVELRPCAATRNTDELAKVGMVSSLLHVLSLPVTVHYGEGTQEIALAKAPSEFWMDEAALAKSVVQALSAKPAHELAIAVLFAASVPGNVSPAEARGVTQYVEQDAARWVTAKFREALQQLPLGEIKVEAFCVAITQDGCGSAATGFIPLSSHLRSATTWAARNGSGPIVMPEVRDLKLPERILGHWSQNAVAFPGGLRFPCSPAQTKFYFESAVDACAADLLRLLNSLPQMPREWDTSLGSHEGCDRVKSARSLLWSLTPPFEEWSAQSTPRAFWAAVQQYLQAHASADAGALGAKATCPDWWETDSPAWDPDVLQAMSCANPPQAYAWLVPAGSMRQPLAPLAAPVRSALMPTTLCDASPSTSKCASQEPRISMSKAQSDADASDVAPVSDISRDQDKAPVKAPSSRRSLTELLRKDAAWTDSLLRGAALLAAKLPVE